mmetsp:Transcript_12174/g.18542  ORF Transcript_12174/g.18542 Transcript_12174/m.18542 type:complete len:279 (-) Transcript_12174:645-1481(-)
MQHLVKGIWIVTKFLSGAFFWSSNVSFVVLETHNRLLDHSQEPRSSADSGSFQKQTPAQQHVDQWVGQKLNWESRSNQLPRNRSKNGSNDGSQNTSVEKVLSNVRNPENIVINTNLNVQCCHTSNDEEAESHTHLTSAHESWKILSFSTEQQFASTKSHWVFSTFALLKLRNCKEGNLHTFQHTNNTHQQKEKDHRNSFWNTWPHGRVASEESRKSHSQSKAQNCKRPNHTSPEPNVRQCITRRLVRFNRLSSEVVGHDLNEVRKVHHASLLNQQSNP